MKTSQPSSSQSTQNPSNPAEASSVQNQKTLNLSVQEVKKVLKQKSKNELIQTVIALIYEIHKLESKNEEKTTVTQTESKEN